jgi:ParB family chromosome partitioning protein
VLGKDGQPRLLETYYTATKPARRPSASGEAREMPRPRARNAPSASLPRSLEEQMAKDRRDVLALHIAHDPALALDLAIFSLAAIMRGISAIPIPAAPSASPTATNLRA